MRNEYTPEQWYTNTKPDASQGLIIDENTGANIAVSYDPKHANLIASAPELLEALKALASIDWTLPQDAPGLMRVLVRKANAAIAKAEGKQ